MNLAYEVDGQPARDWKAAVNTATDQRVSGESDALAADLAALPEQVELDRLTAMADQHAGRLATANADQLRCRQQLDDAATSGASPATAERNLLKAENTARHATEAVASVNRRLAEARQTLAQAQRTATQKRRSAYFATLEDERESLRQRIAEAVAPLLQTYQAAETSGSYMHGVFGNY